MNSQKCLCVLLTTLAIVTSVSVWAQTPELKLRQGLDALRAKTTPGIQVSWHDDKTRVKTIRGRVSAPSKAHPTETALAFLRENREVFQIATSDFGNLRIKRSIDLNPGHKVEIEQHYEGLPVFDGGFNIVFDRDNAIQLLHSNFVPGLSISKHPALTKEQAIAAAKAHFGSICVNRTEDGATQPCDMRAISYGENTRAELGVVERTLVYKVNLDAVPIANQETMVDANSGRILRSRNLIMGVDGTGKPQSH